MHIQDKGGKDARIVAKNSTYGLAGSIIGQVMSMLCSVIIGRILGADGLGRYTFAITLSATVAVFTNLGLSGIVQRDIAKDRSIAGKLYANALFLRIFISLPLCLVLCIGIAYIMGKDNSPGMIAAASIYTSLAGLFLISGDGITAVEDFRTVFCYNLLQKSLMLITSFVTLYYFRDMLLMLVIQDILFLLLILIELKYVSGHICNVYLEYDHSFCCSLIKESLPIVLVMGAEMISLKSDGIMISVILGDSATGVYSVASNIYIALTAVPVSIASAASLRFYHKYSEGEDYRDLLKKTVLYMGLSAMTMTVAALIIGKCAILFLWGRDFLSSVLPLYILLISLFFMPVNRFFEYILVGIREQKYVALCTLLGALFNIGANFFAIPRWGIPSAAVTTVITEMLVMLIEMSLILRRGILKKQTVKMGAETWY